MRSTPEDLRSTFRSAPTPSTSSGAPPPATNLPLPAQQPDRQSNVLSSRLHSHPNPNLPLIPRHLGSDVPSSSPAFSQPYAYRSSSDQHAPIGPGDQVVPTPDAFVGIGDAFAMADVIELLSVHEKEWHLVPSNVMPSRILLAGPIILIGNRSNKWSRGILEDQRFYFGPAYEILDRYDANAKWSLGYLSADWKTNEDYAIVSRFTNPASGQPVIVIAGITIYGTQAAGDFMTSPTLLKEALKRAPTDWKQGNFQFVLHTKVIENTPERPTVVAWNFR